jgi:signal transduction histidine kinase
MSSNLVRKSSLSLPMYLTLWYAVIFTASSVILFTIIYLSISTVLQDWNDDAVVENIDEMSAMYREEGLRELKAEIRREIEVHGKNKIFYRLFRRNGEIASSSNISAWPGLQYDTSIITHISDGNPVFKTIALTDEKKARIAYGVIGNDLVLQTGYSLEEDNVFLAALEKVYTVSLPLLIFIAGLLGWFMARQALRGVREVTKAAVDISHGDLNRRVPQSGRGDELDRMAVTFNDMLDRIQKLISGMREMTDNIAHDLRSPLARIRGLNETALTNMSTSGDLQTTAADTVEECDRLLHMINTMLDITETETGVAKLAMSEVNLSQVIADACELFEPSAEDKRIKLVCKIANNITLFGNIQYLQRLISNLIDNAIKYTEENGKVFVRLHLKDNTVVLSVQDTGIGIEGNDLQNIFKRFYRCDKSRSKSGSGLGLSLALAISHAHGGDINVESVPDKGSTFTVTLPLNQPTH